MIGWHEVIPYVCIMCAAGTTAVVVIARLSELKAVKAGCSKCGKLWIVHRIHNNGNYGLLCETCGEEMRVRFMSLERLKKYAGVRVTLWSD